MRDLHSGIASEDLRARCCTWTIRRGEYVAVHSRPSRNRVLVRTASGGIHKLKASTYRRVVRPALRA